MKFTYKHTVYACFTGYIVQAIINNFAPLLFLTFQSQYGITLDKIALLTGLNFGVQLLIDLLSAKFADKIGYRPCVIGAHVFSAAGLILLTILPDLLPNAYAGLCIAVVVYALGGGLLEVLVSPIMEACPGDEKAKAMSLLHSFYCWGHVAVVLLSSLFFAVFGISNWKIMALLWAIVPILNGIFFSRVPIGSLLEEGEEGYSIRQLASMGAFWVFMLLMACAGACEQAVSQWASAYAESGLKVSKTVGDLAGPLLFAVTMGSARLFYGKFGEKIDLKKFMWMSGLLCLCSYLIIGLSTLPVLGFLGCALCGLSVGILWPGTF
ncbi:MAG: MFS transporter, partial [Lachnospiraceae bacterium]|nr:MFS transporter [Lachnospiraceae bacterium]